MRTPLFLKTSKQTPHPPRLPNNEGVRPDWLLPITVDAGTDNAALRSDPLYVGDDAPRLRGEPYFLLMQDLVAALQVCFWVVFLFV